MEQSKYECYITGEPLTKENDKEHIIPNALGGRLKSPFLIKGTLLNELDAELVRQIPWNTLLNIERDRDKNPDIIGYTEDGSKFEVSPLNEEGVLKGQIGRHKPKEVINEKGEKFLEFRADQLKDAIKYVEKYYREIDIDKSLNNIEYFDADKERIIYFKDHIGFITGMTSIRSICKIAANYYVFKTHDINQVQQVVPFIKGEDRGYRIVHYYLPDDKRIHKLDTNEVSHILYLRGIKKERILYCYIELFSLYGFLVRINDDYEGEDIEFKYCYDLNSNKEIDKRIKLNLSRTELLGLRFPGLKFSEFAYKKRLKRLLKIKGFKTTITRFENMSDELKNRLKNKN